MFRKFLILLGIFLMMPIVEAGTKDLPGGYVLEYELISNTPICLVDCSLKFRFKLNKDYTIPSASKFKSKFRKVLGALDLRVYGFRMRVNETYYDCEYQYQNCPGGLHDFTCKSGCQLVEKWHYVWKTFNPVGKTIKADRWYYIELWGKKKPKTGENNIDAIPVLVDYELPFAWWNSSFNNTRNITFTNTSYTPSNISVLLQVNSTIGSLGDICGIRVLDDNDDEINFAFQDNGNTTIDVNENISFYVRTYPASDKYKIYYKNTSATSCRNVSWNSMQYNWYDDLEDGDISGWWGDTTKFSAQQNSVYEGSYSIEGNSSSSDYYDITYTFNATTWEEIGWHMMSPNASVNRVGHGNIEFHVKDSAGTNMALIVFQDGKLKWYNGSFITIINAADDVWQNITLKNINYSADTFDLYVNNTLWESKVGFWNNVNDASNVSLNMDNADNLFGYWDFIYVKHTSATDPTLTLSGEVEFEEPSGTLHDCSVAGYPVALRFDMKNETELEDVSASFETTITTNESANYSFVFSPATSHSICIYPETINNLTANATIEYYADDYRRRTYYLYNAVITNVTQNISLYLITEGEGNRITFTIKDAEGNLEEDVYVKVQRYYVGNNSYRTVTIGKSDYIGQFITYLEMYDVWYKFILEQHGSVVQVINPMRISATDMTLMIEAVGVMEWFKYTDKISYNCYYNNVTENLVCSATDTSGHMSMFCLNITEIAPQNQTVICTTCDTSSSVTLSCNIGNATGRIIHYSLMAKTNFNPIDWVLVFSGLLQYGMIVSTVFGLSGVFMSFLVIGSITFTGLWRPDVAIVLTITSVILMSIFNLIALEWGVLMSIVTLGGIIIYVLRS